MGLLRLYLAICVIAQHSEQVFPWVAHTGREAVQIFFMISGFYMCMILAQGKYPKISKFYQSRAYKIFIPYFAILFFITLLSLCSKVLLGDALTLNFNIFNELSIYGSLLVCVTNFTIWLQDLTLFFRDNGQSLAFTSDFNSYPNALWQFMTIPQAWSISLELMFYAIVPFLVKNCGIKILIGLTVCAVILRLSFYHFTGLINDPWTYRFFPFELNHFMYGMIAFYVMKKYAHYFQGVADRVQKLFRGFKSKWSIMFFYSLLAFLLWAHKYLSEVTKGIVTQATPIPGGVMHLVFLITWILIIPLIFSCTKKISFDREVGELSYPIYLLHYSFILLLIILLGGHDKHPYLGELATLVSLIVALAFHKLLFSKFEAWRQRFILQSKPSSL